jgi:DNA polymerase III delta prime subunit
VPHDTDRDGESADNRFPPFESNREYLFAWFNLLNRVQTYHQHEQDQHPISGRFREPKSRGASTSTESERRFEVERLILLDRSALDWDRFPVERMVRQLHLDDNERCILLYVLSRELEGERCVVEDVITLLSRDVFDRLGNAVYLKPTAKLRLHDLILIDDSRRSLRIKADVTMRRSVQRYLSTGEGQILGITDQEDREPYTSEYQHIEDWLSYASAWVRFARACGIDSRDEDDAEPAVETDDMPISIANHPLLIAMRSRIQRKSAASSKRFPLDVVRDRYKLSAEEINILLLILESATMGRDLTLERLCSVMSPSPHEQQHIAAMLGPDHTLVRDDLVQLAPLRQSSFLVGLSLALRNYLLGVSDSFGSSMRMEVAGDEFFTLVQPTQTLDDLVLSDQIMDVLRIAVRKYEANTDETLRRWGILHVRDLNQKRSASSLRLLFSGPSGVGKTYAAGALARSLGRDVLTTDISKILSLWVGQSQQNLVRVFDRYDAICRRSEIAPVLLLNECDQFFSQRSIDNGRSVDKMYHQMQNLFLERLESFEGVLIATTNLVESLDTAFSRRFDWKLEFERPSAEARLAIWRLQIPVTVPLADDVDLRRLADEFVFTGGQIAICVKNAASASAIRGDVLRMEDLLSACHAEENGAFGATGGNRGRKVGFSTTEQELSSQIH